MNGFYTQTRLDFDLQAEAITASRNVWSILGS